MADWKISRRRGMCTSCERDFDDGERHLSSLRVTAEGLERADLCQGCQEEGGAPVGGAAGAQDLFWWATRYEAERRRTVQLDLESLERLFLELEGNDLERLQELRYVLCLILMRKRRLKVERVLRTAEGEAFRVKRPRRDERYEVRIFDFTPERMAEIRTEMQSIFDGAEVVEGVDLAEIPGEIEAPPGAETGEAPVEEAG